MYLAVMKQRYGVEDGWGRDHGTDVERKVLGSFSSEEAAWAVISREKAKYEQAAKDHDAHWKKESVLRTKYETAHSVRKVWPDLSNPEIEEILTYDSIHDYLWSKIGNDPGMRGSHDVGQPQYTVERIPG